MGFKHLIECHCILQIYKNKNPPVYHKFPVFSLIKDDKVVPKYAKCTNCEALHYVYEICKSEIKIGKEDVGSIRSISDVSIMFSKKLKEFLLNYNCTIDVYEQIEYIIENDVYPSDVVLKREIINDSQSLKIIQLLSEDKFKIRNEIIESTVVR